MFGEGDYFLGGAMNAKDFKHQVLEERHSKMEVADFVVIARKSFEDWRYLKDDEELPEGYEIIMHLKGN